MIVILKKNPDERQLDNLIRWLKSLKLDVHLSTGENVTILGLIGDTSVVDIDLIRALDIVAEVSRIQEPYKNANRKFHPDDTVIDVCGVKVGGGHKVIIAGPCSVESEEGIVAIAKQVKAAGANMLRGGAFKPRSSPYSFQGLGKTGLDYLKTARAETGLPIVTELMTSSQLPLFDDIDVIQIGARNMQNFDLLKDVGHSDKPVLLKRGLANTLEELLMSAEYIMANGNPNVMLCERGFRTFETAMRNTLDLAAVPYLQEKSHLPVIVDPSHATGVARLVKPIALAATVAGADGLMIEVHDNPGKAWSDGKQSLTPEAFTDVAKAVHAVAPFAFHWDEQR